MRALRMILVVTCALLMAGPLIAQPSRYSIDISSREVVTVENWKVRAGDDSAWAAPQWPDGEWALSSRPGMLWVEHGLAPKGIAWYRVDIRIESEENSLDSLDPLYLHAHHQPNAQEIYWDGIRIAVNGRVGASAAEEQTGRIFQSVRIPPGLLKPGNHVLAMRVSNHQEFSGGVGEVMLGTWKPLQNAFHGRFVLLIFLMGIVGITGVYYFANYITRISRTHALFSLFCLGCTLNVVPFYVALYANVDFSLYMQAYALELLGRSIMMASLPLFFVSEFASVARRWYLAVIGVVALVALPMEAAAFDFLPVSAFRLAALADIILVFSAIAASLGLTAWAVYRRKEGSLLASLGLLCLLVGVALGPILRSYYAGALGLTALILFLNAGLVRRLTRRSLAYQETQLKGVRLEIELLKKNIEPHFLLTSLRSITEWLEKEPKTAARLVIALAAELRMMLKMTSERLISVAEEVKLCRTHLEVMGIRRHRCLDLDTQGVSGEERIPPMVLHTLLEMGLSEAEEAACDIRFLLERTAGKGKRELRDLVLRLSHAATLKPAWQRGEDETGLSYVRARLEECFQGKWSLHLGHPAAGSTWCAEIRISDPASFTDAQPKFGFPTPSTRPA